MKCFKSTVLAALAVLVAISYILPAAPVSAQLSSSLSIVPKKNYTIEPGKSVNDTLLIRNLDRERSLNLSLRVVDFSFTDDTGTPKLFLDENEPQTTWSLKPFLNIPEQVQVAPGGSERVDLSVNIPANQGAGSFYSAIVYSSGASEGGNVGLSASGVSLVFTSVPGEVREDLKLEKFGAYQAPSAGQAAKYVYLAMDEPRTIAYTLQNNGNVVESPAGSIMLNGWFGRKYEITNVNPNESLALIGQKRTFTSCIKLTEENVDFNGTRAEATTCDSPGLWPGYYSANLSLFYGQNGNLTQEITGAAGFWYLPGWFLIVVGILLLIIAFFVWRLVRKIKGARRGTQYKSRPTTRRR